MDGRIGEGCDAATGNLDGLEDDEMRLLCWWVRLGTLVGWMDGSRRQDTHTHNNVSCTITLFRKYILGV